VRWPGVLRKRKKSKAPDGRYTRAGQPLPVAGLSGPDRPASGVGYGPKLSERHPKGSLERRDYGLRERDQHAGAGSAICVIVKLPTIEPSGTRCRTASERSTLPVNVPLMTGRSARERSCCPGVDDDVERTDASNGKEKLKTKDALVSGVGIDRLAVAPVKVKARVVTAIDSSTNIAIALKPLK